MEWLTGRTKYEITSIIARIGRRIAAGAEHPEHRQEADALAMKPTIVTVRNTISASVAVTAMCEVVVKDIGIRPRMFDERRT